MIKGYGDTVLLKDSWRIPTGKNRNGFISRTFQPMIFFLQQYWMCLTHFN